MYRSAQAGGGQFTEFNPISINNAAHADPDVRSGRLHWLRTMEIA